MARRRGMATLTVMGQAPHYLQGTTNPAMRQALLTAVARLLDLELDVSPLDAAVQPRFRTTHMSLSNFWVPLQSLCTGGDYATLVPP